MSQEDLSNISSNNGSINGCTTTNNGEKGVDNLEHIVQQCQEKIENNNNNNISNVFGQDCGEIDEIIKEKLEKITNKNKEEKEEEMKLEEKEANYINGNELNENQQEPSLSSSTTTSSPPSENQDSLKSDEAPKRELHNNDIKTNNYDINNNNANSNDNNNNNIDINNDVNSNNNDTNNNNDINLNDNINSNSNNNNNNNNCNIKDDSYKLFNFTINVTPKIHLPKNKSLTIENLQSKTHQINRQKYSRRTLFLSKRYKSIKGGGALKRDEATTFGGSRLFESLFSSGASCSKILRDSVRVDSKVPNDTIERLESTQDRSQIELQPLIIEDEDLESSSDEEKSYSKSLRERKTLEELEKGINRQLRDKIDQLNMNKQFFESNLGRKRVTLTKEQQEEQQFLESNLFQNTPIPKEYDSKECNDGPYDLLYYTIHPLRGLDKRIDSTLTKSGKRKTLEDQLKESGVETPSFKVIEDFQPYNVDIGRRFFSIYKSGALLSHISHNPNAQSLIGRHQNHHLRNNNNRSNRNYINSPQSTPNLKQSSVFNSRPIPLTPLQSSTSNSNINVISLWNKVNRLFHPTHWSREEIMIFDEMIYIYGFDWTEIARILCGIKSPIQMYKFYSKQQQQQQQQLKPLDEQQILILNHEKEFYDDWNRICFSCFLENCCNKKVPSRNLEKLRKESIYESFVTCDACECAFHLECADPPLTKIPESWYCSNECSLFSKLKCEICIKEERVESMALCLTCNKGYHIFCLDPPLKEVPINDWDCISCSKAKIQDQSNRMSLLQELPKLERFNTNIFESQNNNDDNSTIENNNDLLYNSSITFDQSSASNTPNLSIPISSDAIFKEKEVPSQIPKQEQPQQEQSQQPQQEQSQQEQLHQEQLQQEPKELEQDKETINKSQPIQEQAKDQLKDKIIEDIIKSPLLISESMTTTPIIKNTGIVTRSNKNEVNISSDSIVEPTTPTIKFSSNNIPQSPSALGSPTFFRRSINSPLFNSSTLLSSSSSSNLLAFSTNSIAPTSTSLNSIVHISGCPHGHSCSEVVSNDPLPSNDTQDSNLIHARYIAKEGHKLASSSTPKSFITLKKLSEVCLGCLVQAGLFEDSPFINTQEVYDYVDTIQGDVTEEEMEVESIFSRRIDIILSSVLFATQSMIEDPVLSNQEEFEQQQEEQILELENIKKQLREQIKLQEKQKRGHKNPRKEKDRDVSSSSSPLSPSQHQPIESSMNTPLISSDTLATNSTSGTPVLTPTPIIAKRAYKKRLPKVSSSPTPAVPNITQSTTPHIASDDPSSINATTISTLIKDLNSSSNVNMNVVKESAFLNPTTTTSTTTISSPAKESTPTKKRTFEESQKNYLPVPMPPPLSDEIKASLESEVLSISTYYDIVGKYITAPLIEDKPLKRYKRSKKFSTKSKTNSEDSGLDASILSSLNTVLSQNQQLHQQQIIQPKPQLQQTIQQHLQTAQQLTPTPLQQAFSNSSNSTAVINTPIQTAIPTLQSLTGQFTSSNQPNPVSRNSLPPYLNISSVISSILPFLPPSISEGNTASIPLLLPTQPKKEQATKKPPKAPRKKKNEQPIQNNSSYLITTSTTLNQSNVENNMGNTVNENAPVLGESRSLLTSASVSVPIPTPIPTPIPSNTTNNIAGNSMVGISMINNIVDNVFKSNNINNVNVINNTMDNSNISINNSNNSVNNSINNNNINNGVYCNNVTQLPLNDSVSIEGFKSNKTKDSIGVARGRRERLSNTDTSNTSRWWIFSGNPKIKQELNKMEPNLELDWVVRQHSDNIRKDDKVFIWICGKFAGISATGVILNDPERVSVDSCIEPTLYQSSKPNQHHTLRVRVEKTLPALLPKKYLVDKPELSNMTVIRAPLATNFWVNDNEADTLFNIVEGLINGTLEIPSHYYEQPNPIPGKKGRKPGSTNKSTNIDTNLNAGDDDEQIGEGDEEGGKKRRRRRKNSLAENSENCTVENINQRNCSECNSLDEKENMITCDTCCSYYHPNCFSEPIDKSIYSYWICFRCCMNDEQILNCKLVIGWLEIKSKIKKLLFKKCESFSFNFRKSLNINNRGNILNKLLNFSIQINSYRNQLTRLVNQRYYTWYSSLNSSNQYQLCNSLASSTANHNPSDGGVPASFNAFELDSKLLRTRPKRKDSTLTT
ncbi:hypothetical protein DICPUDRAFT_99744 [Dictyostelium purpureum]|uniref:PHD-type domain-containing protein n=1 Tax=Dictyostelium purpureum TaxID=5786 RepID=F1A246_DICPU|nr:uncharacterized protein DICPUDRAFT_99744 [Dictyostelium purpureum]EGC29729.1 hypothetical protein DICPUDRAFT_99744 [Dictyostelium purpureum]|eukprot:XP_003293740.1 hypothetical protein DICPUDRAFT_99744 [Dictyostelium purpureum]